MKITKSHLKRIIKEELSHVRLEKLVNFLMRSSPPVRLLPAGLQRALREEITDFLYKNKELAEELIDMMLDEPMEEFLDFAMKEVIGPLIDMLDEPPELSGRTYEVLEDNGEALYFEKRFKKELHAYKGDLPGPIPSSPPSPFIKDLATRLDGRAGMTYSAEYPVFLYNKNRQYIEILKEVAIKHGISIIMP